MEPKKIIAFARELEEKGRAIQDQLEHAMSRVITEGDPAYSYDIYKDLVDLQAEAEQKMEEEINTILSNYKLTL